MRRYEATRFLSGATLRRYFINVDTVESVVKGAATGPVRETGGGSHLRERLQ